MTRRAVSAERCGLWFIEGRCQHTVTARRQGKRRVSPDSGAGTGDKNSFFHAMLTW
jgi:hypothetical protein